MTPPVKISVIVPVYNVASYVSTCLQSLCSQTFTDLEIICVNDASTDASLSILEEWKGRDSRIKVVSAPSNGGLSRTRNLAMKHAEGEFLLLVDSDDWVEPDALEEMYQAACGCSADRVVCGYRYFYEDEPEKKDFFLPENVAEPGTDWISCTPSTIGKVHHGANGMMVRRSIVEKYGTQFPEGLLCEDIYFHYLTFPFCERACVVRKPLYVYRKRTGSITDEFASGRSVKSLDYVKVAVLVLEEWKRKGLLEEYRMAFLELLVMCVRNVRKYAPHAAQKGVTGTVCRLLREEKLYRPEEDDARLSRREAKLLKIWMSGKSGLDFSYYWKKMRKAAARMLHR